MGKTRDYELFATLSNEELEVVVARLQRRSFRQGAAIVEVGNQARELFFLARGKASVKVNLPSGSHRLLATFSAGMAFGEMALIDGAPRAATITADTDVDCDWLSVDDFESLGACYPQIKIQLLGNLCIGLCQKLRKTNRDLSAID